MRTLRALGIVAALFSSAANAGPRDVSGYNNALVEIAGDVMERIEEAQHQFSYLEPGPRFDAWRSTALEAVAHGLRNLDEIPPRHDDFGYHAAVRDGFVATERMIREIVSEGFALSAKEHVANADLVRFEALYRELEAECDRIDSQIRDAQREFAAANRMRLIERKRRRHAEFPDFEARGIPPAGSILPGQLHVSFAVRYGNELIAIQNELSSASARVVQAEERELERTLEQSLRAVRMVRERVEELEAWQGDDTLRAGTLEMARTLEASLAGPTREYARFAGREALDEDEVERANAAVAEMNEANRAAHEAFREADARFRANWAVDAYQAWADAREAFEQERDKRRPKRREVPTETI